MKRFLIPFPLLLALAFTPIAVSAEAPAPKELFSTQGKMTELKAQEKMLRVKAEGGLELTFFFDDTTQWSAGGPASSVADFAVGDPVEIQYIYNENFEKVARTIKRQTTPPGSLPPKV